MCPPLAPGSFWFGGGENVQVGREPEAEKVSQQCSFTPHRQLLQQLIGKPIEVHTQAESEEETQRGWVRGQAPA